MSDELTVRGHRGSCARLFGGERHLACLLDECRRRRLSSAALKPATGQAMSFVSVCAVMAAVTVVGLRHGWRTWSLA